MALSMLTSAVLLKLGVSEQVVATANATGTGFSKYFVIGCESGKHWGQMTIQAIVRTVTAAVVDLEVSLDGGVTFSPLIPTNNIIATPAFPVNLNGGSAIYRFNVKSVTNNSDTFDIWVLVG